MIAGGILDGAGITPINAAAASRPSDRTIRFYVTRHLMNAPDGRGTAAIYSYRHLLQLLAIKLRQMEGGTLDAIEKELAEAPGDVIEKRVAATLGSVPPPDEVMADSQGSSRGRVARMLANRGKEVLAAVPVARITPQGIANVPVDSGAWFRLGIGEGLEVTVRADHPAARRPELRARVAAAVARVLAESAEEEAS